jgi:hypothetical protein
VSLARQAVHEMKREPEKKTAKKLEASKPETTAARAAIAPQPEGFINKNELAANLKITTRTVENWQRRGLLPFVKVGKRVMFFWPDVVEHFRTHFSVNQAKAEIPKAETLKCTSATSAGAAGNRERRTSSGLRPPSPQSGEGAHRGRTSK